MFFYSFYISLNKHLLDSAKGGFRFKTKQGIIFGINLFQYMEPKF